MRSGAGIVHVVNPTIVLFGLRGSGKTTLGRLLAVKLGGEFVDLDDRVRSRLGAENIASAFRKAGEPAFRAAECEALKEVLSARDATGAPRIIALGGGTPTHAESRQALGEAKATGAIKLILLEAAPAVLGARVASAPGDRPLLAGSSFAEEALLLSERRLPTYRALADVTVRSDQPTDQALAALEAAARG